jgi:hypothetical protein
MSGPFATATELAEFTGISLPTDLSRMQAFLASASALIRRYTGQTLSQVVNDVVVIQPSNSLTTGQFYPLPGAAYGETIFLPQRPVTAISSVVSNSVTITAYGFTSAGLLYRTDGLPWTYATTVTYTHGYAETTDEYAAIRDVCIEAASRAYTMNFQGDTRFLGDTTAEAAGFAPAIFLTEGEKARLEFGRAFIG